MPTLQARSPGRGTPSPPRPRGLGSLLPHPGLVPPEAPTVEMKMGKGWGVRRGRTPRPSAALGLGLIPLEGQRQEGETPGAGFFKNWFCFNFYYISVFP